LARLRLPGGPDHGDTRARQRQQLWYQESSSLKGSSCRSSFSDDLKFINLFILFSTCFKVKKSIYKETREYIVNSLSDFFPMHL
jgi:hypothetical protein